MKSISTASRLGIATAALAGVLAFTQPVPAAAHGGGGGFHGGGATVAGLAAAGFTAGLAAGFTAGTAAMVATIRATMGMAIAHTATVTDRYGARLNLWPPAARMGRPFLCCDDPAVSLAWKGGVHRCKAAVEL